MTDTFLTDEEMAAMYPAPPTLPSLAYLPFGWSVAVMAEQAKGIANMQKAVATMAQLSASLAFLALDQK